jgi:predicted nucleic acid-binding protein
VIYLDTSVALAHLLAEDRRPGEALWKRPLVSSRLLEYEAWNRINSRGLAASHGPLVEDLIERLGIVELDGETLARARDPFPVPLRTLDVIHLASAVYLQGRGFRVEVATYDARMRDGAVALRLELYALE